MGSAALHATLACVVDVEFGRFNTCIQGPKDRSNGEPTAKSALDSLVEENSSRGCVTMERRSRD